LKVMTVYTRSQFDKLTPEQQRGSWTVTSLKNTSKSLGRIQKLKGLVTDTIHITDEDDAWKAYWRQAKTYLREEEKSSATQQALFVSFRFARQSAYNYGIEQHLESNKSSIVAIRLETQEDTRVRAGHRRWHGVTLPVGHPAWDKVNLPFSWNCRCVKVPLDAKAMNGSSYTPEKDIPPIPEGFK